MGNLTNIMADIVNLVKRPQCVHCVSYLIIGINFCQENGIEEYVNTIEILTEEKKAKEKIIEELEMTVQKDKVSDSYSLEIFLGKW